MSSHPERSRPLTSPGPNAALRGAVSAFAKPGAPAPQAAPPKALNARAAASKAANIPSSSLERSDEAPEPPPLWMARLQPQLTVPSPSPSYARGPSPSNVAAVLAVKKLSAPAPSLAQPPRKRSSSTSEQDPPDVLPSAGTVQEVKKWLQSLQDQDESVGKKNSQDSARPSVPDDKGMLLVKGSAPSVHSPTPQRVISASSTLTEQPLDMARTKTRLDGQADFADQSRHTQKPHPPPPAPRRSSTATQSQRTVSLDSDNYDPDTTVIGPSPLLRPSTTQNERRPSPHRVDTMANAIVASYIASSRSNSPFKHPPASSQKLHVDTHHHHTPFQTSKKYGASRTPSPSKGAKYTMREDPSSSDDEGQAKKRHRKVLGFRKHPHKHHEGDRKRWREKVTDRERKRYEGVWAANRGLHAVPTGKTAEFSTNFLSTCVSNIVTRDIWRRSRLPESTLEEIWHLVDRGGTGLLGREEFIVGLWLIDQVLKGRKLPTKISDSVWFSVHVVQGIRVPKHK